MLPTDRGLLASIERSTHLQPASTPSPVRPLQGCTYLHQGKEHVLSQPNAISLKIPGLETSQTQLQHYCRDAVCNTTAQAVEAMYTKAVGTESPPHR